MVPFFLFSGRCRTVLALFTAGGDPRCISPGGSRTVESDSSYIFTLYILEVNDISGKNLFFITTAKEVEFECECLCQIVLRIFHQRRNLRGDIGKVDDRLTVDSSYLSVTLQQVPFRGKLTHLLADHIVLEHNLIAGHEVGLRVYAL